VPCSYKTLSFCLFSAVSYPPLFRLVNPIAPTTEATEQLSLWGDDSILFSSNDLLTASFRCIILSRNCFFIAGLLECLRRGGERGDPQHSEEHPRRPGRHDLLQTGLEEGADITNVHFEKHWTNSSCFLL
jgi:hypothetical protein